MHPPKQYLCGIVWSRLQAAGCISFHFNADKTEYMCFNKKRDIATLNCGSLKLVNKFNYLESSESSPENDINKRQPKA